MVTTISNNFDNNNRGTISTTNSRHANKTSHQQQQSLMQSPNIFLKNKDYKKNSLMNGLVGNSLGFNQNQHQLLTNIPP